MQHYYFLSGDRVKVSTYQSGRIQYCTLDTSPLPCEKYGEKIQNWIRNNDLLFILIGGLFSRLMVCTDLIKIEELLKMKILLFQVVSYHHQCIYIR